LLTSTLTRHSKTLAAGVALLVVLAGVSATPAARSTQERPKAAKELLEKARVAARSGAWLEACRCYDELLRKERNNHSVRKAYRRCLRRLHLQLRHTDPAYRSAVGKINYEQALNIYQEVLRIVAEAYVDRSKTNLTALFGHGVRELRFALEDRAFRKHHLRGVRPSAADAFEKRLAALPARKIGSRAEAAEQLKLVLRLAVSANVLIRPEHYAVFSLEFAAGACNALDEYSSFLVPGHAGAAEASQGGGNAGVGVELTVKRGKLRISQIHEKGPAENAGLLPGDQVVKIDGKSFDSSLTGVFPEKTADDAAKALGGEPDTTVVVEILRPGDPMSAKKTVKLMRRVLVVPNVVYDRLDADSATPLGYLRINRFTDSTLQDVKEALIALQSPMPEAIKGLILDLRGNPGGLFKSAVSVADLFLASGTIVNTQSRHKDYNRAYKVEGLNPLMLPLVVLVDGETASAAEVLAGAIKEQRPGNLTRIVGQTTYGKGTIQCVLPVEVAPLDKVPAGIRLTVARFLSPSNKPYNGRGVTPHLFAEGKAALEKARTVLKDLIKKLPRPMPTPMTTEMVDATPA
jgi:carboxyl-terminal processing protease